MRLGKIKDIYVKEILETFRDKKTFFMMIVIPLILYPLVFIGTGYFSGKQIAQYKELIPRIVVTNRNENEHLLAALKKSNKFIIEESKDAELTLEKGEVQLIIQVPDNFIENLESEIPITINILFDQSKIKSNTAHGKFVNFFNDYKKDLIKTRLAQKGIDGDLLDIVNIKSQNIANAEKMGAFVVGRLMPLLVLILAFVGAMHTGTSITVGEKVGQTIETLLVSAISREEIVLGKFFTILTTSLITAFLGLLSLLITFQTGFAVLSTTTDTQITISPFSALLMFVMVLPVAGIFSAILIALGSFARSLKEAEMYSTACLIIVLALGMASLTPGFKPPLQLFLIPVMNTTLIQKEILMLDFNFIPIAFTLLSTFALAFASLYIATKLFSREEILFRT